MRKFTLIAAALMSLFTMPAMAVADNSKSESEINALLQDALKTRSLYTDNSFVGNFYNS